MSRLFWQKLLGECSAAALGVFAVLFAIIATAQAVRVLGQAAAGALAPDALLAALAFQALSLLPVVLAITIFVAGLIVIGRAYRDSEMVVWLACGRPLHAFLGPLLGFGVPFVVLVALLTLFVRPWAISRSYDLEAELRARDEITAVAPGQFKETRGGDRIYFVERFSAFTQTLAGVFIHSVEPGGYSVTVARNGAVERAANGDRFLVLTEGSRYEAQSDSSESRVTTFERSELRIEPYEKQARPGSAKTASSAELWRSDKPADIAELQWRLHLPLAALLLLALALPLGYANPRGGRSYNLLLAVLVYVLYSNLLSISNAWVAQGRLAPWPGFFAVHLPLAVCVAVALAWQAGWLRRWLAR